MENLNPGYKSWSSLSIGGHAYVLKKTYQQEGDIVNMFSRFQPNILPDGPSFTPRRWRCQFENTNNNIIYFISDNWAAQKIWAHLAVRLRHTHGLHRGLRLGLGGVQRRRLQQPAHLDDSGVRVDSWQGLTTLDTKMFVIRSNLLFLPMTSSVLGGAATCSEGFVNPNRH